MDIYEEILRLKQAGRASVVATIVQCSGSSPQKEGAKMLIRDDGTIVGTLGGGCIETEVVQTSLQAIKDGCPLTIPFELTEKYGGLVCGGKVLVYIEPVIPDPHLVILGAGHVGKALSKIARFSGFKVTVVDDREEYANRDNIPDANETVVIDFENVLSKVSVDQNTYIVIATRGHNHDLDALKVALGTKARFIGLLGSKRKKALLFKTLKEEGFTQRDIDRVIIPVGLSIGSVTPEEIAISIMAQIIKYRRENAHQGLSNPPCSRFIEEDGTIKTTPSLRNKPIIRHCLDNLIAAGIKDIVVVLGPRVDKMLDSIKEIPIQIVFNRNPESEMAESVRIGLRAVAESSSGVLVCLSDHPLISVETLKSFIQCFLETPDKIIIPLYKGKRGHPTLFPRNIIKEIFEGNTLRDIIQTDKSRLRFLPVQDEGVILDMDTKEDYERILKKGSY